SSTLGLTGVAASDAGSYGCVVTNAIAGVLNPVTSDAAALTVNTSVAIVSQPASATLAQGDTATLTFSVTGAPGAVLTYQWKKGGVDIVGATGDTLVLANLTGADAASYTCAVTASLNGTDTTVTSAVAVVAVNTVPVITTAPVAQGITTGQSAS